MTGHFHGMGSPAETVDGPPVFSRIATRGGAGRTEGWWAVSERFSNSERRRGQGSAVPVIGITGGIGAGKSAVAAQFASLGCVVSDSDSQARVLLDDPAVQGQLVEWWGNRVVSSNGVTDRRAIAAIVFAQPTERVRLETLIHPLLKVSRERLIAESRAAATPPQAVIIDAPLLLEANLDQECDAVVFVDAPRDQRLTRVVASRGWNEAELARRESAQLALEEKRARSGYIVINDGHVQVVHDQVAQILHQVRQSFVS